MHSASTRGHTQPFDAYITAGSSNSAASLTMSLLTNLQDTINFILRRFVYRNIISIESIDGPSIRLYFFFKVGLLLEDVNK